MKNELAHLVMGTIFLVLLLLLLLLASILEMHRHVKNNVHACNPNTVKLQSKNKSITLGIKALIKLCFDSVRVL